MRKLVAISVAAMLMGSAASAANLVYCSEGSPEGFDPALYTSGTTFDASSRNVYDRLVHFVHGETEIEPGLAESWDVSEDGLEYTFKLREGVKFHTTDYFTPTRDMNADDVIFSLTRQGEDGGEYHNMTDGASYEYFNSMSMPDLIESVEKVDDLTVKITLTRPESPMLANLAMSFASIGSKEYADNLIEAGTPELFNQQPIGTGPFKFVAYQKDAVIRYARNDEYWREPAAIENLVFAITPDASVRYQKLRAGECHVMPYPNPADLEAMKSDENINVVSQEGLNVGYLAYNTQMEPFDDPAVRKALNMAIDKQAIVDGIFQGAGSVAKNPIPPTMWSYNDAIEDDPYDPEAARAALEEAGVTDLSMSIWAMPVQRPYNPNARRMAEMIQADLSEIGVDADIVSYEWGEYLERSKSEDRDGAVLLGWTGDNGDPDNFLAVLLGCDGVGNANRAQWCNEDFENLIQQAKVESDQAERTRLYEEAQVVFKEQAPWATIAHSVVNEPISTKVQGYKIDPFGGHVFYGVSLTE
ncbi:dipeptide transport system substrate-binding protein [Paracoccus isoporae]|uniref:Dipeptide transport system substrate-binding protein n=1 Tax=Paracoccus isoporae TaxID=591205 RepID=A0A1G6W728_9RHOB|nr:ABC transporter substrate-binding protein [Paracoccus isoporae]SDD61618.1 dipeptide transport system substrate-binding protein [Paracoccus isoporae]